MRKLLYRAASLLGDANAILRGTIVQRLMRKMIYRLFSSVVRWR